MYRVNDSLLIESCELIVGEQIGQGGYGEVWKAEWNRTTVAVKKIKVKELTEKNSQDMLREASTSAKLNHPNIVRFYAISYPEDKETWIIMELADCSLYDLLKDLSKKLPWRTRWQWATDAAAALEFLHRKDIIHRDIKSLNFLLVGGSLKLTDFGWAIAESMATNSMQGSFNNEVTIGTPRWAAPECSDDDPIADKKSDVYGLGMVLWELVSRQYPFQDQGSDTQVIKDVRNGKRPNIPIDCPSQFTNIIVKCWNQSPTERPSSKDVLNYMVSHFAQIQYTEPSLNHLFVNDCVCLNTCISSGSYGELWTGKWAEYDVTIKKALLEEAISFQTLESEIEFAAKLKHPSILQLFGVYNRFNELWVIMDYASENLHEHLADYSQDIPWSTRWKWAEQAAIAVAFLHSKNVIHCAIKSLSFLITMGNLKITDFRKLTVKTLTDDMARWQAPECMSVKPVNNQKSDVFSLGMVLYEIASRQIPFGEMPNDSQEVAHLIEFGKRPFFPDNCPTKYADIIKHCWEHSPEKRPSATEVSSMIHCAAQDIAPTTPRSALDNLHSIL